MTWRSGHVIYQSALFSDRPLLGMKGIMSRSQRDLALRDGRTPRPFSMSEPHPGAA
jgi:hypothetical protein